jgi:GST-like protein
MELYFAATPNSQRALIALEETGLAYRLHHVDLYAGEQRTPAYLDLNPLGAVPVLVDPAGPNGRIVISQSICVLLYIAEKSGSLIPVDRQQRFEMIEWLMLTTSDVAGTNTAINQLVRSAPEPSDTNIAFFERRLMKYFAACDARLATRDYLAGEFTLADISLYPFVAARRSLIDRVGGLAHLRRWAEVVKARPATLRAMAR